VARERGSRRNRLSQRKDGLRALDGRVQRQCSPSIIWNDSHRGGFLRGKAPASAARARPLHFKDADRGPCRRPAHGVPECTHAERVRALCLCLCRVR